MPHESAERHGGALAYRRSGSPTAGRSIVLLHSLGEDSSGWDDVAAALARRYAVYAMDLPGHGASHRRPRYSLELMRDDLLETLDHLGLVGCSLVGHSLGGMVAYLAALEQPAAIGQLVLEEAPPPLPATPAHEIPDRPPLELPFDWDVVPAIYAQRNDPDPRWWNDLATLAIPTLLIAGGETSHINQRQLAEMADRLPNAHILTIDAGHNVHAHKTRAFVEAIESFVADY